MEETQSAKWLHINVCWGKIGGILGNKNKNPLASRLKGICMETAGVEPASKDPAIDTSTCVVLLLNFTIHLKTDIRMYR